MRRFGRSRTCERLLPRRSVTGSERARHDGFETARGLRGSPSAAAVLIVGVSGYVDNKEWSDRTKAARCSVSLPQHLVYPQHGDGWCSIPVASRLPGAMKQEYSVRHLPSLLHAMGRSTSSGTSRSSSDLHVRQTYVSIAPSAITRVRRSRSARWGTASAEESRHREHSRQ